MLCTRLQVRREMKQNHLDGLAFAMVILRAEDAGAAVVNVIFWISDISFNIDLGLMKPGRKFFRFLVEKRYSNSNDLNQSHQVRPGPIFRKSHVEIGLFDQ